MAPRTSERGVELVVTAALAQEVPRQWLIDRGVQVHTLGALRSGALRVGPNGAAGLLCVITGVGPAASRRAATWIRDHLQPLFVVNVGTAATLRPDLAPGQWVMPRTVLGEDGGETPLDTRLPFRWPDHLPRRTVDSLLTVSVPVTDEAAARALAGDVDCADMEAAEQARLLATDQTSFHVLKIISDRPGPGMKAQFAETLPRLRKNITELLDFIVFPDHTKVAVVIPVHDRAPRIGACIQSVLEAARVATHAHPEVEIRDIVVVDDGSTDGTAEVAARFGAPVRVLRLSQNRGVSAARNHGVAATDAPWLAFVDSDDLWDPDKLLYQWRYLRQHPFYEALQSEEIWVRRGVRVNPCKHHRKPRGWAWLPSLQRCLVSPSSVLVTRRLLEELGGFDERLVACEDYDLWLRLCRHRPVGLSEHRGTVKHGGHPDQLSARYPAMDRFRVYALLKALDTETLPAYRRALLTTLREKLEVLRTGAAKRGGDGRDRAAFYATLSAALAAGADPSPPQRELLL